jgi:hypothetical protein
MRRANSWTALLMGTSCRLDDKARKFSVDLKRFQGSRRLEVFRLTCVNFDFPVLNINLAHPQLTSPPSAIRYHFPLSGSHDFETIKFPPPNTFSSSHAMSPCAYLHPGNNFS